MEPHAPKDKSTEYFQGIAVLVGLAILTGIEYVVGTTDDLPLFSSSIIPLTLLALIKAGIIVNYYMHISHMWNPEEHEDDAHDTHNAHGHEGLAE